jgi:hypothetical protein
MGVRLTVSPVQVSRGRPIHPLVTLHLANYNKRILVLLAEEGLKVVCNEKGGGSGSKLLLGYGFGSWRSMSF